MPRTGPRLPIVGVRLDPTSIDALAAAESEQLGREVKRSEMIKILLEEALAARASTHS